jgi:hypothetical protein
LGLLLGLAGCGDDKPTTKGGKKSTGTSVADSQQTESPCEGALATIDEVFKLSKLSRTTTISDGVLRLNDWQRSCAPADLPATISPDIEKLLSESQISYLAEKRFLLRDGEHLRDCLLDRALSTYAVGKGATELERVTNVFQHVVRAIGLLPETPEKLPLTPYEVYLMGKGTAEDRAWVFINILRQLRIDAVLLAPQISSDQSATDSAPPPFLVGVLLDGQVYLYEPRAGIPIPTPAGADPGKKPPVATLAQATADPEILQQLDNKNRKYEITAGTLKQAHVSIVSDVALWSPRMQGLQTQFVGARAMVIADPLGDAGENAPGAIRRMAQAGGDDWDASRLRLWEFSEKRLVSHAQMTTDQQEILAGLLMAFGAFKTIGRNDRGQPVPIDVESHEDRAGDKKHHPSVNIISRTTTGAQMRARLNHLEGNFAQAIREYLEVRDKCREFLQYQFSIPEQIRHNRAWEDATYWTALCQYEQGELKAAINMLTYYRKKPDFKNWHRETRYLMAVCQAADGNYPAAIAELEQVEPEDLETTGYQVLIRQWQAAGAAATK